MPIVTKLIPLPDMKVAVTFNTGEHGIADLSHLNTGAQAPLTNPEIFARAYVAENGRTVEWPGINVSVCTDGLYWNIFGHAPLYPIVERGDDTIPEKVKYAGAIYREIK